MPRPASALSAIVLTSLLLQSCSDGSTAPVTREITLRSCSPNVAWAAYQNDRSNIWTRIDLIAGATVRVTPRLAIAAYHPDADDYGVTVDFLTADQAAAKYSCNDASVRMKTVHGSVPGLASLNDAYVTITPFTVALLDNNGRFTTNIVDGVVDLLATLNPAPYSQVTAMIIRRGLDPSDGATLAPIDFASDEAFAPEPSAVTVTGIPPGWNAGVGVDFYAGGGIGHTLSYSTVNGQSAKIYSVPSSRSESGDYHLLNASVWGDNGYLKVNKFSRIASAESLAFGPQLPEPVFTTVATTPTLRCRIEMTAQAEYSATFSISLQQGSGLQGALIIMTASKEYFAGTPATWSLTVPDFSSADGFSSSWGLTSGTFRWVAMATNNPNGPSEPTDVRDGDVFRWANRGGSH